VRGSIRNNGTTDELDDLVNWSDYRNVCEPALYFRPLILCIATQPTGVLIERLVKNPHEYQLAPAAICRLCDLLKCKYVSAIPCRMLKMLP